MNENITDIKGFRVRGCHVGIKSKRRDLALIVSDVPASAAGVFTKNRVKAAPVLLSIKHLADGKAQAIVVSSGNANACTGQQGIKAAERMAKALAGGLKIAPELVVVSSTGVIGVPFPTDKVVRGIKDNIRYLSRRRVHGPMVANAIMTTDTFQKEGFVRCQIGGKPVSMAGIAKGSGMIHPDMATMLGFIASDANIEPALLKEALNDVTERTFNMISVDGDTSTNDMVVVLCNGMAANPRIKTKDERYGCFVACLEELCLYLAKAIVSDGEGSTKLIEYRVINARTRKDARRVVRTVSNSNLVRTAMFGLDPNWGRILAAAGRAGVEIDPNAVDIAVGSGELVCVAKKGGAVPYDKKRLKQLLLEAQLHIVIDLHQGNAEAVGWGSDFSYEYVRINAEYTS